MGHMSISQPSSKLTIQIASVLHVSVKLRAVALTYLVTLKPKALNRAIEHAMTIPE
jgi:hypothetical protein